MTEIYLGPNENLISAFEKISAEPEEEILLKIAPAAVTLDNIFNIKLLQNFSETQGKKLKLETEDPRGKNYLDSIAPNVIEKPQESSLTDMTLESGGEDSSPSILEKLGAFLSSFIPERIKTKGIYFLALSVGAIALLLIFLFSLLIYFPKAIIKITVGSEVFVKSLAVTASSSNNLIDYKERVIPSEVIIALKEGEKVAETTGTKTIGKKARGVVTLYNKTDNSRLLPQGTTLSYARVEGENLLFSLDATVSVPERSIATSSAQRVTQVTYDFGKVDVAVTADDFGEEYNLSSASILTVGGLPDDQFLAQNVTAFSGGDRRDVKIVSEDDQKKLKTELEKILKEEVLTLLKASVLEDSKLLEGATDFSTTASSFSYAVGEEANDLKFTGTLTGTGIVFKDKDLLDLVEKSVPEFIPEEYDVLSKDRDITEKVAEADFETGSLSLNVKIKSYVIPKIDEAKIKKDLAGRSLNYANEYLGNINNVSNYDLSMWPPFSSFLGKLPNLEERIVVQITRE